jgi:hypothetical protein
VTVGKWASNRETTFPPLVLRWKTVRCDGQHSVTRKDRLTTLLVYLPLPLPNDKPVMEHGKSGPVQRSEVPFLKSCLKLDMWLPILGKHYHTDDMSGARRDKLPNVDNDRSEKCKSSLTSESP